MQLKTNRLLKMNDIRDVKPPVDLPDFWWLLWLLLALAVLAGGVAFFLGRRKFAPAPVMPLAPEVPAWEKAYQQLEALRQENLVDQAFFKEFFIRVSDIVRHYMENRFNIRAPHMSTEEFLYSLAVTGHLNEPQNKALQEFLNSCDMVKFAKYSPTNVEAWKNFDLAKRLVDDTRI